MAQLSPELLDGLSPGERVGRAYHVLDSIADVASPLPMPDAVAAWYGHWKIPHRRFDIHWQVINSGLMVTGVSQLEHKWSLQVQACAYKISLKFVERKASVDDCI